MLNENAIANAFAVTVPPVVDTKKFELPPLDVPTIDLGSGPIAATAPTPITDAITAKRNAKVDAIVRQLKPAADEKYSAARRAKGLPVGTMAVKVHSYFLDLYRAAHPKATREQAATEVNSLIAGALEAGVIWASLGGFNANTRGSLKWYYSSAEYPKPVSKAVQAIEKAKAEAAELGW